MREATASAVQGSQPGALLTTTSPCAMILAPIFSGGLKKTRRCPHLPPFHLHRHATLPMLFGRLRPLLWKSPEGFAAKYCTKCKAGWTRKGKLGSLTVCLLDREPVLPGMVSCDRYEERTTPSPQAIKPKATQEILVRNSKR